MVNGLEPSRKQTRKKPTNGQTSRLEWACVSAPYVCVHAAKDGFKPKKSTCASTLGCARRYKITEKENED